MGRHSRPEAAVLMKRYGTWEGDLSQHRKVAWGGGRRVPLSGDRGCTPGRYIAPQPPHILLPQPPRSRMAAHNMAAAASRARAR